MHNYRFLVMLLTACGGSSDAPIDCPGASRGHELVTEAGVERWCARADGVLAGPYRVYDVDGALRVEGGYADDQPHGLWQWLEDGAVVRSGAYVGGVPCGTWSDHGETRELVDCDTIDPAVGEAPAREEGELVAGVREGLWKSYLGDGTLVAETRYADGSREGPATTYHWNGDKACQGDYRDDQKDGAWTCWHDNGVLASEQRWALGVVEGTWRTFDRQARPLSAGDYVAGFAEGTWSIWSDIGYFGTLALRAKRSGPIVGSQAHGLWRGVWEVSGAPVESEVRWVSGLREGAWTQHWPGGQLAVEGYFFSDLMHGRWRTYSDSGVLISDAGYLGGWLDGDYADYYDDGDPKSRGSYHVGARVGTWSYWDADGTMRTESCDAWGHCQ